MVSCSLLAPALANFLYPEVMGTLKGQLPKDDLSREG